MNRILTYGLATVLATAFTPTVFADKDDHGKHGGGGGGRGGGGAPARASAPAHFSAPRVSMSQPKGNAMRAPSTTQRIAPQTQMRSAPIAQTQPTTNFRSSGARSQRNSPSVAFGGHAIDSNNQASVNTQTRRSFANGSTQQFAARRGDSRNFSVPFETSRNWDRGRMHEWNNHRFRFIDGAWVIIDPGYDYGYADDYGVTTYSAPAYDSGSLVMSAQDRLNRLGYNAGPADGVMGPQTRDAIADFQGDNGLPRTGGLNTATVRALGL